MKLACSALFALAAHHAPYDTTSIPQFLTRRFKPGVRTQQGDLSNAFELGR